MVPIKRNDGAMIGVVQLISEKTKDEEDSVFDENDEKMVQMLALRFTQLLKLLRWHVPSFCGQASA